MPAPIDTTFQQAVRLHKAGRLAEAERLYRTVLQAQPGHADASHNLGVLAVGVDKPAQALPLLKAALQAVPTHAQYWVSYIDALIRAGHVDEARAVLAEGRRHGLQGAVIDGLAARLPAAPAVGAVPGAAAVEALLAAQRDGRLADAERLAVAMTRDHPQHPLGWSVLGSVHQRQGRLDAALQAKQQALALAPGHAPSHFSVGHALASLGRLEEAEAAYRRAIELQPDHAQAHSHLGAALLGLSRLDEAAAACRQAIALQPDLLDAHGNLAIVLRGLGQLADAEASARRAVELQPGHAGTHANLAAIQIDRGRLTEAEASCRRAIALQPAHVEAHTNLGVALMGQGRFDEAVAACRQAIALEPTYADAHSNLLFSLNFMAEVTPQAARQEALAYGRQQAARAGRPYTAWQGGAAPSKLRVGLVSGDFRDHPVGYFLQGLLAGLEASRLELLAYPTNALEDVHTARLRSRFHGWHPLWRLDDEAAARRIHADGVHILIDLAGHTAHNRLPVFAFKPAPVQAAWLGYFATTGLREIDWVIGDPQVTPVGEEDHFVEHIWRLPETYFCFSPPADDVAAGPLPALANGHLTFGCFNNLSKLNDATARLWARVLQALPGSRLMLKAGQLADAAVARATRERFAALGVAPERLDLEGPSGRQAYLEAYRRIDVALDPFPFPGGTTSVEGLWMGVPVLTRRGDRFIGHNGETIARNTGQAEWIAGNEDDYVAKAAELTADLGALARLRAGLRAQVLASPLFDSARFARHFEAALWDMWAASVRPASR